MFNVFHFRDGENRGVDDDDDDEVTGVLPVLPAAGIGNFLMIVKG